ncbi:MAG: hypothetical protein WC414_01900 [Patescibacteria group bacterium]
MKTLKILLTVFGISMFFTTLELIFQGVFYTDIHIGYLSGTALWSIASPLYIFLFTRGEKEYRTEKMIVYGILFALGVAAAHIFFPVDKNIIFFPLIKDIFVVLVSMGIFIFFYKKIEGE